MKIKLKKDQRYSICSCGLSKVMPYCDNQHREYNKKNNTNYKSIKISPNCNVIINLSCSKWIKDINE